MMNTSSLAVLLPDVVERKVRQIFADKHGKQIARYLLERKQLRDSFDLYRMRLQLNRGGYSVTDVEILQFFEKLDRAGLGKLVMRKLPHHNAFECGYQSKMLLEVLADSAGQPGKAKAPVRSGTGRPRGPMTMKELAGLGGESERTGTRLSDLARPEHVASLSPTLQQKNAAMGQPGGLAAKQGRALPVRFNGQTILLRGLPERLTVEMAREIGAALLDLAESEG